MLTLHYGLYQLAVAMALGFAGAYLIQGGLSLQEALSAYAALLALRCLLRFAGLQLVRKAGYRRAVFLGALLAALQFWPMSYATHPFGLAAWLFVVALAESLYWPVYHSAVAVTGVDGSRGRELGIRAAVGAIVAIAGPFTGGLLMQHVGAVANFAIAGAIMAMAAIPLFLMRDFDAGPVPGAGQSLRNIDSRTFAIFASDGWMSAGMHLAWPMVLFVALDSNYEQMGLANALAGIAGAAGALLCGRAIDRGSRDKYLMIVSIALAGGLLSLLTDISDPKPMGISLSDHLAGMTATNGILGALIARGRTGRGQLVETSLLESTLSFCGENAARFFENGKVPGRATRTHQAQVYAFTAADGKAFVVHLSSPTKFWEALTRVAGHPEWIEDPRYRSKELRGKNYDALNAALADVFRQNKREHWLQLLLEADVPSAPLNTFDDVFSDPQVQHLKMRIDVPHPKLGSVGYIRNGVRLSETPTHVKSCSPELGEHNEEILGPLRQSQD